MKKCPQCSNVVSDDKQKCDVCGLNISQEFASTVIKTDGINDSPTKILQSGKPLNATSSGEGGFVAGTVLAKWYRILGLLRTGELCTVSSNISNDRIMPGMFKFSLRSRELSSQLY